MKKLITFLKPYWLMVVGVILFTLFNVYTQLYIPNLMGEIVDFGVLSGDVSYILRTGGKMLFIAIIGAISLIVARYLAAKASMAFGRDLRLELFTRIENFSLQEFNKIGTSSLITRTTNDVNQLQQVTGMILRMLVRAPIMLVGGVFMAISKNKELSRVFLISAPILIISIALIGKRGFPYFKIIQEKIDGLNQVLREELNGIRVIRAFNREDFEHERFNESNKDLTDTLVEVMSLMAILRPVINLILNFTTIGVLWFGSKLIDMNHLQIGDLLAFLQYVMQIMFSLLMVSMVLIMIPRASASAKRVNEVLDLENTVKDKEEVLDSSSLKGKIEFKDVSFKYKGAENPVLCDLNFSIEKGETLAIIGGTGSGKSTLINLIPRFYDTTKGEILLDGVNIADISQEELRDKIGLVPQKANLFQGTILSNIRFGKEDASIEEVKRALKIAQAYDFVNELDDKLDSYVAQGGTNYSGGQKQRLSIARAIVKEPEIYIFDDSFSALDFKTDKKLRKALKDEIKDKTIIIIAQRVSTIMDADKIIVLEDGKIVGRGKHKDLLENNKVYREIVRSQLSEEEI